MAKTVRPGFIMHVIVLPVFLSSILNIFGNSLQINDVGLGMSHMLVQDTCTAGLK